MSRSGTEEKPPWQAVPLDVRRDVEALLGARVVRARRTWGGYGPTPTFRLTLVDGRRAFFKGVGPDSNDFSRFALVREERVYRELSEVISPWAPAFFGACHREPWHVLLLEDLGPKSAPPWTPALARNVARGYAEFHRSTLDRPLPDWLTRSSAEPFGGVTWGRVVAESDGLRMVAGVLAEARSDDVLRWLREALPTLSAAGAQLHSVGAPYVLVHVDTRSDNLRYAHGRLRLFDWPFAAVAPAEIDVAAFAQSVAVEGGPEPERLIGWYEEVFALHGATLRASVAMLSAFFADAAWRPDVPGLPRLRPFQRDQLRVCLAWSARCLRLPEPPWLS